MIHDYGYEQAIKRCCIENLEKPISDYCGGTGTMANFFKMLSKCKQNIIEQMGTDYSDETVLSLTNFISCVQLGVLCSRSDSFCIIRGSRAEHSAWLFLLL